MICDKHLEFDCPVCAKWLVNPSKPRVVLTPWIIKKCIRTIMTDAAVRAAQRRVRGQDQG